MEAEKLGHHNLIQNSYNQIYFFLLALAFVLNLQL